METVGLEGEVVEALGCLADLVIDGVWIEPITPSVGFSAGGLAGSVLGQGA